MDGARVGVEFRCSAEGGGEDERCPFPQLPSFYGSVPLIREITRRDGFHLVKWRDEWGPVWTAARQLTEDILVAGLSALISCYTMWDMWGRYLLFFRKNSRAVLASDPGRRDGVFSRPGTLLRILIKLTPPLPWRHRWLNNFKYNISKSPKSNLPRLDMFNIFHRFINK